jgi:hypothetical protein
MQGKIGTWKYLRDPLKCGAVQIFGNDSDKAK